jgi:hypothetical protein
MDWKLDLLTPLGITSNCSAIANLCTLQITTAPAKALPVCVSSSRSLVTASNNGDTSASRSQVSPSSTLTQNCLPVIPSTELNRHLFSASLAELHSILFFTIEFPTLN